jgi:hypothetical protein
MKLGDRQAFSLEYATLGQDVVGICILAKVFDSITPTLHKFIQAQQMFFVATAPLTPAGHVNVSPKGFDCFRIFSPHQVGYLDVTGSGNETSAHLEENGRITFMFCAFQGAPMILRLYGQGRVVLPSHADWEELYAQFAPIPGTRQIVMANLDRVQTSCGTGVPLFGYESQREELVSWAEKKGEAGLKEYWSEKNQVSIDGIKTPISQLL